MTTFKINKAIIYCIIIFFAAQALYCMLHLGFITNYYGALNQVGTDFPAHDVIRKHFWQSIFYYHLVPPLYIFYTYGFVELFPPDGQIGIYLLHTLLGLWAVCSLYQILNKFHINTYLSLVLISLYVFSPQFNLFESMGWYDFPTAALLIIATWRLMKFADQPSFTHAFIFFSVIGLLCSIRSMYHIALYFVPVIIICAFVFKKQRKIVLLSCVLPFLFVFSFYLKNYLLFDYFSINSYAGEPLAGIAMQKNLTLEQRQQGINKGFFSDLALCPQSADTIPGKLPNFAFTGYHCYNVIADKYRQAYIKKLGKEYKNIPVLNEIGGTVRPHRNVLGNIGMSLEFQKNAVQAIIHYPTTYLKNIIVSVKFYFTNTLSYFYLNMGNVRQLPPRIIFKSTSKGSYFLVLYYPWLILFSMLCLCCPKKLEGLGTSVSTLFTMTQKKTIAFILGNIIFSSLIMILFTANEQQRYRFYVDGLYLILTAIFIQYAVFPLLRKLYKTR